MCQGLSHFASFCISQISHQKHKINHMILMRCHRNDIEGKMFNYMLEINILRNSSPNHLGVMRGGF